MPRDGSGNFSLTAGNPVTSGTTITSTWANTTMPDIATALTASVCADGQKPFAANQSMGGFKLTSVGNASSGTDAANLATVQAQAYALLGSVAGTNTITAAGSPGLSAYASGQTFRFIPANTNTGATTINIDGVGAKNIYFDGRALVGGEIVQNVPVQITYDGTQFNITSSIYTSRLTTDSTPDRAADYVTTYDVSAAAYKKVLINKLVGSGGRLLIQTQSPSGALSVDFTTGIDTSIYQSFILEAFDLVGNGGASVNLLWRGSTSGGAPFKSGASDYAYEFLTALTSAASTPVAVGSTSTSVVVGTVYTGSYTMLSAQIFPSGSSGFCKINYQSQQNNSTPNMQTIYGSGYLAFSSVNAFQLLPASGTLTGTVNLYGILK